MIGWLAGRVVHQLRNGAVLIDVQGVGYEVHVASSDAPPFDELLELLSIRLSVKTPFNCSGLTRPTTESFSNCCWRRPESDRLPPSGLFAQ
jgi:hypothetical protein